MVWYALWDERRTFFEDLQRTAGSVGPDLTERRATGILVTFDQAQITASGSAGTRLITLPGPWTARPL